MNRIRQFDNIFESMDILNHDYIIVHSLHCSCRVLPDMFRFFEFLRKLDNIRHNRYLKYINSIQEFNIFIEIMLTLLH